MDDDELNPDQFRAAMRAGEVVTINPGSRPTLITSMIAGAQILTTGGGGTSSVPTSVEQRTGPVPALAR